MKTSDVLRGLRQQEKKNSQFLHLTAYENQLSLTARSGLCSKLSERYFFGSGKDGVVDWDPFTCLGMDHVQDLLDRAAEAFKGMMGCDGVNFSCLSGVHAMMCAILSVTDPGDNVMIVHHDDGGHFATKHILERTGRKYCYAPFDQESLTFKAEKLADIFKKNTCRAIYLDISYPTAPVNVKAIREALGKEAIIIFDASHTLGLMMGGKFQSPFSEGADIVCANTHKTLPGPQKGLIAFRKKFSLKINSTISNGLVSSPHLHHLLALGITILEMEEHGEKYAAAIVQNANFLGEALERLGYEVRKTPIGSYSESHQVHLFIEKSKGKKIYKRLVDNYISTNFDDRLGGRLFMRLGTQEITRRGMGAEEMKTIARFLDSSIKESDVSGAVKRFNAKFKKVYYSFD